jgi:hypothetical protein
MGRAEGPDLPALWVTTNLILFATGCALRLGPVCGLLLAGLVMFAALVLVGLVLRLVGLALLDCWLGGPCLATIGLQILWPAMHSCIALDPLGRL